MKRLEKQGLTISNEVQLSHCGTHFIGKLLSQLLNHGGILALYHDPDYRFSTGGTQQDPPASGELLFSLAYSRLDPVRMIDIDALGDFHVQ